MLLPNLLTCGLVDPKPQKSRVMVMPETVERLMHTHHSTVIANMMGDSFIKQMRNQYQFTTRKHKENRSAAIGSIHHTSSSMDHKDFNKAFTMFIRSQAIKAPGFCLANPYMLDLCLSHTPTIKRILKALGSEMMIVHALMKEPREAAINLLCELIPHLKNKSYALLLLLRKCQYEHEISYNQQNGKEFLQVLDLALPSLNDGDMAILCEEIDKGGYSPNILRDSISKINYKGPEIIKLIESGYCIDNNRLWVGKVTFNDGELTSLDEYISASLLNSVGQFTNADYLDTSNTEECSRHIINTLSLLKVILKANPQYRPTKCVSAILDSIHPLQAQAIQKISSVSKSTKEDAQIHASVNSCISKINVLLNLTLFEFLGREATETHYEAFSRMLNARNELKQTYFMSKEILLSYNAFTGDLGDSLDQRVDFCSRLKFVSEPYDVACNLKSFEDSPFLPMLLSNISTMDLFDEGVPDWLNKSSRDMSTFIPLPELKKTDDGLYRAKLAIDAITTSDSAIERHLLCEFAAAKKLSDSPDSFVWQDMFSRFFGTYAANTSDKCFPLMEAFSIKYGWHDFYKQLCQANDVSYSGVDLPESFVFDVTSLPDDLHKTMYANELIGAHFNKPDANVQPILHLTEHLAKKEGLHRTIEYLDWLNNKIQHMVQASPSIEDSGHKQKLERKEFWRLFFDEDKPGFEYFQPLANSNLSSIGLLEAIERQHLGCSPKRALDFDREMALLGEHSAMMGQEYRKSIKMAI